MESFSLVRRLYFGYLSRMYALMHGLSRRRWLGVGLSTVVRWVPIVILLIGWLQNWPVAVLAIPLLAAVWVNYSLWRARHDNYSRFVASGQPLMGTNRLESLPPNEKVQVEATGLFSISGRESRLLLRPAQYWRVPLGDHIVMAEEEPGRYLYQFFSAESLQDVRGGFLLYGPHPVEALAVTFLVRWGPDYTRFGQLYESGQDDLPPPKRVTIVLTAREEATRRAVWQTIVSEARRARRHAGSLNR